MHSVIAGRMRCEVQYGVCNILCRMRGGKIQYSEVNRLPVVNFWPLFSYNERYAVFRRLKKRLQWSSVQSCRWFVQLLRNTEP